MPDLVEGFFAGNMHIYVPARDRRVGGGGGGKGTAL